MGRIVRYVSRWHETAATKRRTPTSSAGRVAALGLSLLLVACGGPASGSPAPSSSAVPPVVGPSASAATRSPAPSNGATDSITIADGVRYATEAGGIGWVLTLAYTYTSDRPTLLITRLSLIDGTAVTTAADDEQECCVGPAASADDKGHLWFTNARRILRIDEPGGPITRWDLPAAPDDAAPSDEDPSAGGAGGAAWDARLSSLLFVRFADHRLYRFDPASATFSTVTDLVIRTDPLSRVSIGPDGSVAVNGFQRVGKDFVRTAVIVPASGKKTEMPGVEAICIGPLGAFTIDASGAVKLGGNALGSVAFQPYADVRFACDGEGNAFTVGMVVSPDGSKADLVIYRFSLVSQTATVRMPLELLHGTNPHTGAPMDTWDAPNFDGLLPDGAGGVWLLNKDGTSDMPGVGPSTHPSFVHFHF
jgi:hypothetical protein